ncbi:MAG TPA: NAD-dependent epimerase/dehydratase family protein [Symbiobacteriaceae bacterium]
MTGGAGFIGSHVVERLLETGHRVTIVDDLSTGCRENVPPGAAFYRVSTQHPRLSAVFDGVESVVHLAAQTSVAASVADPSGDAHRNIMGTLAAIEAARRARVKRFVYISSAAVYGRPQQLPVGEGHRIAPLSPYGFSKFAGEEYLRLRGECFQSWSILRLANVYGPRQSAAGEAGVVARWAAGLTAGRPIELHSDGDQTRDFVYAGDVADAIVRVVERAAERCAAPGCVLNIGTGRATSVGQLLTTLSRLAGYKPTVNRREPRPGDIRDSVLDASAARQVLDWEARTPLAAGLDRTMAWFRETRPRELSGEGR